VKRKVSQFLADKASLVGRTALVTGAAGHLGFCISETLADLGAHIVMVDKQADSLDSLASKLAEQYSIKSYPVVADFESPDFVAKVYSIVSDQVQSLDILVNNAAFVGTTDVPGWSVEFEEQSVDTWERALSVNLTAPFALVKAFSEMLRRSKSASVINIGSIYGIVAPDMRLYKDVSMGNPAAYAASKACLTQLTRWLASALSPNIRVNSMTPGGIFRNQPDKFCQRYKEKALLGRMAIEEDFKGAIIYLATDLSSYVTGHNLIVDGGWTVT